MSERKFYRTVITVEVLSEEPYNPDSLSQMAEDCFGGGDCSGKWSITAQQTVDGPQMAQMLKAQGSDPEFFQLAEDGKDLSEEE
jgi:hypothetical protein